MLSRLLKLIIFFLCLVFFALSFSPVSFANSLISVYVNNMRLHLEVPPQLIAGRTLLPIRAVSESIEATSIVWESSARRVTIRRGERLIVLHEGSNVAHVDNRTVFLDVAPTIVTGRIMVPIRFIAENMGVLVTWNQVTRTIQIINYVPITSIEFSKTNLTMLLIDSPVQLNATIWPNNASNKNVLWQSSDTNVITVSNTGLVTPVGPGNARVSATTEDRGKVALCDVVVLIPKVYLSVDETVSVKSLGVPVAWSFSDNSIVEINPDGIARGIKPGITEAVATTQDGLILRRYTFRVVPSKLSVFRNSYLTKDFVEFSVLQGRINVNGSTLSDNKWAWLVVTNVQTNTHHHIFSAINPDSSFNLSLSEHLLPGNYKISLSLGREQFGRYTTKLWDLDLVSTGVKIYFPVSLAYKNNVFRFESERPDDFQLTQLKTRNHNEKAVLRDLASKITYGLTNDYEKVFAISKWVSENIYYDWDVFRSGSYKWFNGYETLESKRAICSGYALLTAELISFLGIPNRVVFGYVLGYGFDGLGWGEVESSYYYHAWNEAFVNERWIKFDTTWNSRNRFENGIFTRTEPVFKYFDMTMEFFSLRHKITD